MEMDATSTFLENIRLAQALVENETDDSVSSLGRNPREITSEDRAKMFRWEIIKLNKFAYFMKSFKIYF